MNRHAAVIAGTPEEVPTGATCTYAHVKDESAQEALSLVEESIASSSMVVIAGPGGVGKREPARVIGHRWRNDPERKAFIFPCMEISSPKDFVRDMIEDLQGNPQERESLRSMTRQLAVLLRTRKIGLLCIADVHALSPKCIGHIPRLFDAVRALGHPMGLLVTADKPCENLVPLKAYSGCMASVWMAPLDDIGVLRVLKAWDDRYKTIYEHRRIGKPQGIKAASIIFQDCRGIFARMRSFHECVRRIHPEGLITTDVLERAAKLRSSELPSTPTGHQLMFAI